MNDTDHSKRQGTEFAGLLDEHNARVAMLEPFVPAHSLMTKDFIQRAEQQNARRALALKELCIRYSNEVRLLLDRHHREMDEMRGGTLRTSLHGSPPAAPSVARAKE